MTKAIQGAQTGATSQPFPVMSWTAQLTNMARKVKKKAMAIKSRTVIKNEADKVEDIRKKIGL
jgi:hypothetical protein